MTGVVADDDGWTLTLAADGRHLDVGCGNGRWQRTAVDVGLGRQLVVEATGGWSEPDAFTAELTFVQTPHRMTIRYAPGTGSSMAAWYSVPLGRLTVLGLATPRTP